MFYENSKYWEKTSGVVDIFTKIRKSNRKVNKTIYNISQGFCKSYRPDLILIQ